MRYARENAHSFLQLSPGWPASPSLLEKNRSGWLAGSFFSVRSHFPKFGNLLSAPYGGRTQTRY